MHRILLVCAFLTGFAPRAFGQTPETRLAELRRDFSFVGKPVPPKVFADFGDDDLSDPDKIVCVTVDVVAASGNRRYTDGVARAPNGWVVQRKPLGGAWNETESIGYTYVGATENGLLIVIASFSGGGSGFFHTLHVLDAAAARGFDGEGKAYDRLNLTALRNVAIGDRWRGSVRIAGNRITLVTEPGPPNNSNTEAETLVIAAERP
jgi:hypothetical protein